MSYRFHACRDQVVTVTDHATKGTRAVGLYDLARSEDDYVLQEPFRAQMTIIWMLFDPCSALFIDSIIRERQDETDKARRERSKRRKEKQATDRERWATKYGARI